MAVQASNPQNLDRGKKGGVVGNVYGARPERLPIFPVEDALDPSDSGAVGNDDRGCWVSALPFSKVDLPCSGLAARNAS
jgi:hypothetical protein